MIYVFHDSIWRFWNVYGHTGVCCRDKFQPAGQSVICCIHILQVFVRYSADGVPVQEVTRKHVTSLFLALFMYCCYQLNETAYHTSYKLMIWRNENWKLYRWTDGEQSHLNSFSAKMQLESHWWIWNDIMIPDLYSSQKDLHSSNIIMPLFPQKKVKKNCWISPTYILASLHASVTSRQQS